MNPHRTTDPAKRAAHIAEQVTRHIVEDYFRVWLSLYETVLRELAG